MCLSLKIFLPYMGPTTLNTYTIYVTKRPEKDTF